MKAVLTTKISPSYDDLPEFRYHFPQTYLRQISAALDDWIVYYEPRRSSSNLSSSGGSQSYFATAQVYQIVQDQAKVDHYYALVRNFLPFDNLVPFAIDKMYFEDILMKDDRSTNKGAFGRAVRNISEVEYKNIIQYGLSKFINYELDQENNAENAYPNSNISLGFAESAQQIYDHNIPEKEEKRIVERLTSRIFRDSAFSAVVKSAYNDTCAMTGVKLINGGGRSEVQAAHIRPVADSGPDSVRNGIALSGTIHWMFDRGLISVDDDYKIITAKEKIPDTIGRILNNDNKLILPEKKEMMPHKQFLKHHRESIFKG
jgi:putative restriction endonuclease